MAVLNDEQVMLRDMAREWTNKESPVSAFRAMRNTGHAAGYDPAVFAQMAEMGWTGIVIPEAHGGSDFGTMSLGLVLEELGRTLTAAPIAASAAAAMAIRFGGNEAQQAAWLPQIASGALVATLAVDDGPHHDPERVTATVTDGVLNGTKAFVAEGDSARLFVVAAKDGDETALFLVPGDAVGVSRSSRHMVDSRSHAEIRFEGVALGDDARLGGADLLEKTLDHARAFACAEMLGMAVQAFATTNDYLKTRVQFGQLLSTFQALQHRMAKLFSEIELMRSAVEAALEALDGGGDARQAVSLAKAVASDTLNLASREMIQLHGGIGMTDEHDAGFYLKRARVLEAMWGSASFHRERFARLGGY